MSYGLECSAVLYRTNNFFICLDLFILNFFSHIMCFSFIINDYCRLSMISRRGDSGCAFRHPHMVSTTWHVQIDEDKQDIFTSYLSKMRFHAHIYT